MEGNSNIREQNHWECELGYLDIYMPMLTPCKSYKAFQGHLCEKTGQPCTATYKNLTGDRLKAHQEAGVIHG